MRWLFFIGLLLLTACSAIGYAEPTPTPYPTYTPYPTPTAYPTYTPYPTPTPPPDNTASLIWPHGQRDDVIPYTDAADFVGETVIVEGTIVDTYNSGQAVFLNFDDTVDSFHLVIFPEDWAKFPQPPETLLYGQWVRVEGAVTTYQNRPQIIVREPWQLEVALTLGQPILTECDCQCEADCQPATAFAPPATTPVTPTATIPPPTVISWEEAPNYIGVSTTVAGQVVDTHNSGNVVYLNFAEQYQGTFRVVIFPDAWSRFPAPPEQFYANATINVTGQISTYRGSPQIIVDDPSQIEVLE